MHTKPFVVQRLRNHDWKKGMCSANIFGALFKFKTYVPEIFHATFGTSTMHKRSKLTIVVSNCS